MKHFILNRVKNLPVLFYWSLFAAGLVVKSAAPGLEISHGAFVIPPTMVNQDQSLQPDVIVGKERRMQLTSAILTLTGALGLAFCYRGIFLPRSASTAINRSDAPLYGTPGH